MLNKPSPVSGCVALLIKCDPPIGSRAGPGREDSARLRMGVAMSKSAMAKYAFTISKFTFFNSILNSIDVGTDFKTYFDLWGKGHKYWASLTMLWTFSPILVHLPIFLVKWARARESYSSYRALAWAFWNEVGVHFPFFTPLRNLYYSYKLWSYGYGGPNYDRTKAREVEEIMAKAGMTSQAESFCEAGPQATTQAIIILSTGTATYTQLVSVGISVLSLSWGAARAYFILRSRGQSDPDPAFGMALKWVFLPMLAVTVHSLLVWSTIGSLLGPYTLFAIPITMLAIYAVVRTDADAQPAKAAQEKNPEDEQVKDSLKEDSEEPEDFAKAAQEKNPEDEQAKDTLKKDSDQPEDFALPSALFSVWLPCVVGNRPR